MIVIGARYGGLGLGMMGGLGVAILSFLMGDLPSDPPVEVILMIAAVVTAAGTLQAAGGMDYLVDLAEKALRKHPPAITLVAPLVAYVFTLFAGTGHVAYAILPVIAEVSREAGVRPERPLSISVIASQQAITASPISAATVALHLLVSGAGITLGGLLALCIPATLAGVRLLTAAQVSGDEAEPLGDAAWDALVEAVGPEDPFLMIFTSGTTGRPKGVRLPQRSIVHAIDAGNSSCGIGPDDLGVHFLPFAHVAGHDQFFLALALGHALLLVLRREDIERSFSFGPTYAFSVPLIYDRFRTAVETKVDSLSPALRRMARASLQAGVRVRVEGSRSLGDRMLPRVADRLVGGPLRQKLGGRMGALFCGAAPACGDAGPHAPAHPGPSRGRRSRQRRVNRNWDEVLKRQRTYSRPSA